jgi:hypothetical protein
MDKIQFALKLAKDCTYADEMTEGAKQYLRDAITEALNQALHLHVVSGKQPDYKTIHAAAVEYAQKEWAHANDVDTEKKYSSNDFHAGAQWALSQVACASSAVDKTVSADNCDHAEWVVRHDILQCAFCGKPQ